MIRSIAPAVALVFFAPAQATGPRTFTLAAFAPPPDPAADATPAFARLFSAVAANGGGDVTIPPGRYYLPGATPVSLPSNTRVRADGAEFVLPEKLGDRARLVLFAGENVRDFSWTGGTFRGRCFDPDRDDNPWEPNANTRVFLLTTARGGGTRNVAFRGLRADDVAGAAVTVLGAGTPGSESGVDTFAEGVTVEDCTLLATGKFMWDYGLLWQITVWPEDYDDRHRRLAAKYFPEDLVRDIARADGDKLYLAPGRPLPPVAATDGPKDAVVFYGDTLPGNVVRGRQYFVVESRDGYVRVADRPGGPPVRFAGGFGPRARLIHDHFRAFLALYAPVGAGPGKGAIDLVGCKDVRVTGCRLSARGDTMHIQKCRNIVFANNQITGSRMGAFFLAEYCRTATVTGNTVDGTNGSRVMSVEKSCADVTVVGNTFRNGGRGSWINQPTNFVLANNVFVNNTTKCEPDPRRGRKTFLTGTYESYPELYFTLHQPAGAYAGVVVTGNVFETGPQARAAVTFAANGTGIVVRDNVFRGHTGAITVDPSCRDVVVRDNVGAK